MSSSPERSTRLRLVASGREPMGPDASPASGLRPSAPSRDDSEILAGLRRGDASAATALHDRVRPMVDRTLRRLLGSGDMDHDDLAQLALVELVTTIHRYRGECSLDSWTKTVTAHVAFKEIRRRRLERRIFSGIGAEHFEIGGAHGAHLASHRSLVARIARHLEAMDPSRSWTYLLHDVWGYDLREIATITGVTIAAAQTRLVRGRRELHERIQEDPELADALGREGGAG
jgi:RNA polymerase sigma-70 factor (ECF subfamily)